MRLRERAPAGGGGAQHGAPRRAVARAPRTRGQLAAHGPDVLGKGSITSAALSNSPPAGAAAPRHAATGARTAAAATSVTAGDGSAASIMPERRSPNGSSLAATARLLLQDAQRSTRRMAASMEQLLWDGTAEAMPSWDASEACGVLMAVSVLGRRPSAEWLAAFWAASLPRLPQCTEPDLAMLSFALSELLIQPPPAWSEALLATALRLAEQGSASASGGATGSAVLAQPGAAAPLAPADNAPPAPPSVRPINSAYDMEDLYGSERRESSSSLAAELLAPVASLWRSARAAAASAAAAWARGRGGSELVTVVFNLSTAGVRMGEAWLSRYTRALGPRLRYLSGDDLLCLLQVAAAARVPPPPPEWQAELFARVDGINWALQGETLAGCLSHICELGLLAPRPWVRRQLERLQPLLPTLTSATLAELGAMLPALPLPPAAEATAAGAVAGGAAGATASAAATAPDRRWLEQWLADYRAVTADRRESFDPAELVAIVAGVQAASGPAAAASTLRLRTVALSYSAWRSQMVAAVALQLPGASLGALTEAWQALTAAADALPADTSAWRPAGEAAKDGNTGSSSSSSSSSMDDLATLRALVADGLAAQTSALCARDVAPVLSALAAARMPLPRATLDALLAAAQPLLPSLGGAELVTVALSLAQLPHRPSHAWHVAFCQASRRRLPSMTSPQRASLLVAAARMGVHLPDPWLRDFFAASERGLEEELGAQQLANVLWAVSCAAREPPVAWMTRWEAASMPLLRELGPSMLAVVLKAMATLHHRPSRVWQVAFFAALQRRLFVAGAAQLSWPGPALADAEGAAAAVAGGAAGAAGGMPPAPATALAAAPMLSPTVTTEALNSLIYSLASLDLRPPAAWLDELLDAVRCKLSLLSTLDLSVVLAYLVEAKHTPSEAVMEDFLHALEGRLAALSAGELAAQLIMLHALKAAPGAHWLDAFCAATQDRLPQFHTNQLLQLLSCLHLYRHRPGQSWMAAYTAAVGESLPRFAPIDLARVLMLLDHLNQRPSASFMSQFFALTRSGLAQLETQELVSVAWAVVSCSFEPPPPAWTEALVEAVRPRLAVLAAMQQQQQLRVLVTALSHMHRTVPSPAVAGFLALCNEFVV